MSKFTAIPAYDLLSAPVSPLDRVRFLMQELNKAVYETMRTIDEDSELYLALSQLEETTEFGNDALDVAIKADANAEQAREQAELDAEEDELNDQDEMRHQRIESYAIHGVGYR